MAIYIDSLAKWPSHIVKGRGRKEAIWCHLVTDGDISELHEFAKRIGVSRQWFYVGSAFLHYDLVPLKRVMAIQEGAIEIGFEGIMDLTRKGRQSTP